MRAIVFNDTSRFHHGCAAVMRVLLQQTRAAGLEILETVYGNTWLLHKCYPAYRKEAFEQADIVIVNGEGTMHDDSRLATYYMDELLPRCVGKKIFFVNTIWQRMSPRYGDTLAAADLVTVREPLSHLELGLRSAAIMPDLSFYDIPPYSKLPEQHFVKGTFYGAAFSNIQLDTTIDVTKEDWGVIVNKLRHAKACLTGKHHEVIACCLARCPFLTPPVSTHKISGLGAYIDAKLPELAMDADAKALSERLQEVSLDDENIFSKLFDELERIRATIGLTSLMRAAL